MKPKHKTTIPNFWNDSAVTEENYCAPCVGEEEAERLKEEGVPMELCDECCEDLRAERKRDERGER